MGPVLRFSNSSGHRPDLESSMIFLVVVRLHYISIVPSDSSEYYSIMALIEPSSPYF